MTELSRRKEAFIRPSPAGETLGGVARRTREALLLCEAAGFDVVIVETVGVGQSETAVAEMTDMFLLLLSPGGGDDLQGVKRGVMELADLLIVNKADGDLASAAERTASDYAHALRLMHALHEDWQPERRQMLGPQGRGHGGGVGQGPGLPQGDRQDRRVRQPPPRPGQELAVAGSVGRAAGAAEIRPGPGRPAGQAGDQGRPAQGFARGRRPVAAFQLFQGLG